MASFELLAKIRHKQSYCSQNEIMLVGQLGGHLSCGEDFVDSFLTIGCMPLYIGSMGRHRELVTNKDEID